MCDYNSLLPVYLCGVMLRLVVFPSLYKSHFCKNIGAAGARVVKMKRSVFGGRRYIYREMDPSHPPDREGYCTLDGRLADVCIDAPPAQRLPITFNFYMVCFWFQHHWNPTLMALYVISCRANYALSPRRQKLHYGGRGSSLALAGIPRRK